MKISPEEKAFLDLVRDADDPSPVQREQVRRGLVAAMGGAAALSGAAAPAAASALASGAAAAPGAVAPLLAGSGILVAKVVVVVALAGAAIGGGALLYTSSRSPTANRISSPPAEATASLPSAGASPSTPLVSNSAHDRSPTTPQSATGPSIASLPSELPARPAPTIVHAPPAAAPSAEDVPVSSLEGETLLVRAADASLRAGDPATALTLLDEHARRFPRGVLEEERAEERVLALCALGRDVDARAATASFLRDHAKSPLVAKVRHSCAGDGSGAP